MNQLNRNPFVHLSWNDIEEWAGARIVARGRNYQRQGRVSDLSITEEGWLLARVDGTELYATAVRMADDGVPVSTCSCPYRFDCKHGVAAILEYLKRVEGDQPVPTVPQDDDRLRLLKVEASEDEGTGNRGNEDVQRNLEDFLKGKTGTQLIELVRDLAQQYPEIARDLSDRQQLITGDVQDLVERLREEIRQVSGEAGWQDYWRNEGFTPSYSGIRNKLNKLLKAGCPDHVLSLGRELISNGLHQVEMSRDEGETAMEISACLPVVVKALDRSSLEAADRLDWALDVLLEVEFDLCDAFADYLCRSHPTSAWDKLADRLLDRLRGSVSNSSTRTFSSTYRRDQLSNWAVHALECAGRTSEIIPLCIDEAKRTDSYGRLVELLVQDHRHEEAEWWIHKGIQATQEEKPGIAAQLRRYLREIRMRKGNWPLLAAMEVEDFVRRPSVEAFVECRQACSKASVWPNVRKALLFYLEKGELPWLQNGWPLPNSGFDQPAVDRYSRFPLVDDLIRIAIHEDRPDEVLKWYDQRPNDRLVYHGPDEDLVATAVQNLAPDRAVTIWKHLAERLIAKVSPRAYQEAVKYLRKAAEVMEQEKRTAEWEIYLDQLTKEHSRKRRLLEILDGLEGGPIVARRKDGL